MNNKRFKKSNDKMIAGICSGIAEYLDWKTNHVRTIFLIAKLLGASGLIIYTILNFIMPNSNTDYLA